MYAQQDHNFTTGGDKAVAHRRLIGSGGYGDVHESFARKIVRVIGPIREGDIKNEASAVGALQRHGKHQNVVAILGHNWLPNSSNCYFIDMELCDFSLLDYIDYHNRNGRSLGSLKLADGVPPTILDKGKSVFARMQNTWIIGSHIAGGLEFMHAHGQAHRDLNPRNVLYRRRDNSWKLIDFGLSSEASSMISRITEEAKGTVGYRAPELIRGLCGETSKFTNKVDIWALGCVVYELAFSHKPFPNEFRVYEYSAAPNVELPMGVPSPPLPDFLQHQLAANLNHLLHRDPNERPSARIARHMFLSYYKLFESDIADVLIRGKEFLSYIGWQKLVSKVQDEDQILHRLADKYERQGEKLPADELRKQLIRMEVSRKFPGARGLDRRSAAYRLYLELVFVEKGDTRSAWEIYKRAIVDNPFNYAFWHGYCRMSIANNMTCSEAIAYCKKYLELRNVRSNRAPLMALANLYAADGDYGSAIKVYAEYMDNLTDQEEQWVISLTKEEHYQIPMLNGGPKNESSALDRNKHALKRLVSKTGAFEPPETSFHFAAWNGNLNFFRNASPHMERQDTSGLTPLHLAVWNLHTELVEHMLRLPCPATSRLIATKNHHWEWTAIHFAAWNGDNDMVEVLLNAGSDVSSTDHAGKTPMHFAALCGHVDVINTLKGGGGDILARESRGKTPLHYAAAYGRVEAVKALGRAGADLWSCGPRGWTAMHSAAQKGRAQVLQALFEVGGSPNCHWSEDGSTPMHWAAHSGYVEAIEALAAAGAHVSAPSHNGDTAMHWAAQRGRLHAMEVLIRLDGAVNAQNREGWTPLHWAASRGDLAAVDLLLQAGGNPSVQAKDGRTALHWAAHGGNRAVFEALLRSGGDTALRDNDGNTAATLISRALLKATSETNMSKNNEDSDEDQGSRPFTHELDTASALDPSEEKLAAKAWTSVKETWKNSIRRRK